MAISRKAAGILLTIILYVCYFTVILPIGLIFRVASDPLRRGAAWRDASSVWVPRARRIETPDTARNPF